MRHLLIPRWIIVFTMLGLAVFAIASRDWSLAGAAIAAAVGWWEVINLTHKVDEIWKLALPTAHKRY